jgi:hypothetical protein
VEGKGRGLICIIPSLGMCLEWMEDRENPGRNANGVPSVYKPKTLPLEPAGAVHVFL